MESFFSTVKSELADRFASFGEAKMELFDYIEVFYNQRRRHSTLGQISPAAFERRAHSGVAMTRGHLVAGRIRSTRIDGHATKCLSAFCDHRRANQDVPDQQIKLTHLST